MSAPKPADRLRALLVVADDAVGEAKALIEADSRLVSALRSREVLFHVGEARAHLFDALRGLGAAPE